MTFTAQSEPVPQRQPVGPQLSARASHAAHVPPAVPHCVTVFRHDVPLQQPVAHEVASQMHWLLKQREPVPQAAPVPQRHAPPPQLFAVVVSQVMHMEPLPPHWVGETAVMHVVPAQQPVGHEVASQTHWLFEQ